MNKVTLVMTAQTVFLFISSHVKGSVEKRHCTSCHDFCCYIGLTSTLFKTKFLIIMSSQMSASSPRHATSSALLLTAAAMWRASLSFSVVSIGWMPDGVCDVSGRLLSSDAFTPVMPSTNTSGWQMRCCYRWNSIRRRINNSPTPLNCLPSYITFRFVVDSLCNKSTTHRNKWSLSFTVVIERKRVHGPFSSTQSNPTCRCMNLPTDICVITLLFALVDDRKAFWHVLSVTGKILWVKYFKYFVQST